MTSPLTGITIVDLTQFLSGPFGTQILGDLGAEVLKIEPPQGDVSRTVPPHFIAGDSAYFLSTNRNKKSLVIDAREAEGRDLIKQLAATADVLIENYRPGVAARLGLGYDELHKANSRLIWCSISGFGQDGPYRDRPAYDMIVQAISGGMSMTGERGGPPVRTGVPIGDLAAGMYAVIGILAALHRRGETGEGEHVDISMLDCQIAMLSYQASYYLHSGNVPGRQGRGHDAIPTYRCFTCGDGVDIAVTANSERMWQALCEVLGQPGLATDARFVNLTARLSHRAELEPLLETLFLAHSAAQWATRLEEAGIPAALVNTVDVALADPQVHHREMVVQLEGSRPGQHVRVAGNPIKYLRAGREPRDYPPARGSETREILLRMGLNTATIDKLHCKGVVKSPD